jgi:hypothetical protein
LVGTAPTQRMQSCDSFGVRNVSISENHVHKIGPTIIKNAERSPAERTGFRRKVSLICAIMII